MLNKYKILAIISMFSTAYFVYQEPSAVYVFLLNLLVQLICFVGIVLEKDHTAISFWKLLFFTCFLFNFWRAGFALVYPEVVADHRYIPRVGLDDQIYGALVFFIGILFTFLGYALSHKLNEGRSSNHNAESMRFQYIHTALTNRIYIKGAYIIAIVAAIAALLFSESSGILSSKRVFTTDTGVVTRFGPIRFILGAAYLYILTVLYYRYFAGKKLTSLIAPALILVAVGVVISLRIFIVLPLIPFIFDNFHKIRPKRFFAFLCSVVFISFLLTYTLGMRTTGGEYKVSNVGTTIVEIASQITNNLNFGGYLPTAITTSMVSEVAPVYYGETLIINPIRQFIPRTFLPSKPEELGGEVRKMLQQIGFFPTWLQGGIPPGAYAEFWLNFRWFGVLLGSAIFGWCAYTINVKKEISGSAAVAAYYSVITVLIILFFIGGVLSRLVIMWVQLNLIIYALATLNKFR